MQEIPNYPENRLDIRMDAQGNISFEQNAEFAKNYAPTREEKEEELEALRDQLELLEIDEPEDLNMKTGKTKSGSLKKRSKRLRKKFKK